MFAGNVMPSLLLFACAPQNMHRHSIYVLASRLSPNEVRTIKCGGSSLVSRRFKIVIIQPWSDYDVWFGTFF